MVKLLLTGITLILITFIYCSLVVAKEADECVLEREEKLNWKK